MPPQHSPPSTHSLSSDPFRIKKEESFDDDPYPDAPQFTWRATITGCLLGTIISASNFYMGLKLGWTFGASIFGAIFGFTILQALVKLTKGRVFTAKEHCTLQTAATAAGGGTTAGYISGIPAMYRLGLMTTVQGDLFKIFLWAIAASLYGIFFAIPLRKYFILKQKLVFPTPTGAANIIKSFHASSEGAESAGKKTRVMLYVMFGCMFWLLISFFVPVLKSWHVFWWLGKAFNSKFLLEANAWNFYFTLSFAFFGAGLMTSPNNAISTMVGAFLGWGVVAPILLANRIVYTRFSFKEEVTREPSARYWLLWPGILMMVCASFTELGCQWRMLWRGIKGGAMGIVGMFGGKKNQSVKDKKVEDDEDADPAPAHEQVPLLWWSSGLGISIIITVVVLKFVWGIGVGETLLAILLGFIFAFIGIQSAGETDINPTGAIAKTSQIILAALPPINPTGAELKIKQTANLAAGLVSAASAHQSTDMVGDLKTGHLLRASPRAQFTAQIFGSIFSIFTGLAFWVLFSSAYPCITNSAFDDTPGCPFALQAVTAWQGVTIALTTANAIPTSALLTALGLGLFTIVYVVIKNNCIPKQYHGYLPNMNAMGVALVNIDQSLIIALFLGSIGGLIWEKRSPSSYEMYMFAVAAGLVAGEGVFGTVQAGMTLATLKEGMGSMFGMPTPH